MHEVFMKKAIALAIEGIESGSGPFAALIVKDSEIIGQSTNRVTATNDPSAHAEICAIRLACAKINNYSLEGSVIYSTCEPCPMCLGAIYWARLSAIYYAANKDDAEKVNFDDGKFYKEMAKSSREKAIPMLEIMRAESLKIFDAWQEKRDKVLY
jgi:guanine deaminase